MKILPKPPIFQKIANQLKECYTCFKRKIFHDQTFSSDMLVTCNISTWLLFFLITATYIMFLNASYGTEISRVFLNVDQAYFKSIVHSLEKHWHLFPTSLENISNIGAPYHHLDSQIKYLFTHILSTNHAIFLVNFLIFFFLGYSIYKLKLSANYSLLLFLFAFFVLKLPSPNEILQIARFPLDFQIKSDLFHNSNTTLALAFLTYTWNLRFGFRLILYALSFYIKSPAVPAFFIIELYLFFFSDSQNKYDSLPHLVLMLSVVILTFIGSYYLFFNNPGDGLLKIIRPDNWISFRIRDDIVWFANGKLLYAIILLFFTMRLSIKSKSIFLTYLYYPLIFFLFIYDSVGLIKINIPNFYQVEFFLKYAALMIILCINSKIQTKWIGTKLLNKLVLCIVFFNCYLFAHFLGALIFNRYDRFSEYVDNSHLIEVSSSITNETDVVAFNSIDSPIRKYKQLQLCGIIKNPLWVSNLLYVSANAKVNVKTSWKILNQALAGKIKFPNKIIWLILDKSKNNYDLIKIYQEFTIIKETDTHILFKKTHAKF